MLKKIINNNIFINTFYCIAIICTFAFLLYKLRYAIVIFDDVLDLIINEFKFYHGRFFSELFALIFVRGIPKLFDINIQDFAFISQNILKSVTLVIFAIIVSNGFFIWGKKKQIYKPLFFIFSFLAIYIFLMNIAGEFLLYTLQFFFGYVLPLPIFIIIWYKLADYYINNKNLTPLDSKILILLALLIAQSNELVCIILFLLLSFIGIEKIIKRYIYKQQETYKWILYPLVATILMSEIVYTHPGFIEIVNNYKPSEYTIITVNELFQYLHIFFDKIFTSAFVFRP